MTKDIEKKLLLNLPEGSEVQVLDPNHDGQHFEAIVMSPGFEGLSLVKQHQMVMNILKEELKEKVHALALKTYTPTTWASRRNS